VRFQSRPPIASLAPRPCARAIFDARRGEVYAAVYDDAAGWSCRKPSPRRRDGWIRCPEGVELVSPDFAPVAASIAASRARDAHRVEAPVPWPPPCPHRLAALAGGRNLRSRPPGRQLRSARSDAETVVERLSRRLRAGARIESKPLDHEAKHMAPPRMGLTARRKMLAAGDDEVHALERLLVRVRERGRRLHHARSITLRRGRRVDQFRPCRFVAVRLVRDRVRLALGPGSAVVSMTVDRNLVSQKSDVGLAARSPRTRGVRPAPLPW